MGITAAAELKTAAVAAVRGFGDEYRLPQRAAADYLDFKPGENVRVLTSMKTSDGEIPLACEITTTGGAKILLYNINASPTKISSRSFLMHGYVTSRTLKEGINGFLGAKMPRITGEYADMQFYCRREGDKLGCLFVNFYDDAAYDLVAELDGDYELSFAVGCEAEVKDGKLAITTPVAAFGYAFAELRKK